MRGITKTSKTDVPGEATTPRVEQCRPRYNQKLFCVEEVLREVPEVPKIVSHVLGGLAAIGARHSFRGSIHHESELDSY